MLLPGFVTVQQSVRFWQTREGPENQVPQRAALCLGVEFFKENARPQSLTSLISETRKHFCSFFSDVDNVIACVCTLFTANLQQIE